MADKVFVISCECCDNCEEVIIKDNEMIMCRNCDNTGTDGELNIYTLISN